jgi:NAD(P) transhydrogenase
VKLVDARPHLLEFCDDEVVEALQHHLRELGVVFRLGERVTAVQPTEQGTMTTLESGKKIMAEAVLYSAGRQGATDGLDLEQAGLEADARGRIVVDGSYRTSVPNVYAAGDVIGFPALASTSMEQGRLAAANALGIDATTMRELLPIGLYAVPEISFVGKTEEELTAAAVPYEVGIARYRELARGQILGDAHGMLKLLVGLEDRVLLGVHTFGTGATELVHIGQAVMAHGGTVDFLVETVFNYPTLAEAYKVAALDAVNKMRAIAAV